MSHLRHKFTYERRRAAAPMVAGRLNAIVQVYSSIKMDGWYRSEAA
jgi:hypothetical protein